MPKQKMQKQTGGIPATISTPSQRPQVTGDEAVSNLNPQAHQNDAKAFFTPGQAANRWNFHPESVRRLVRQGSVAAIILGRRVLIPAAEIARLEAEGRTFRNN